MAREGRFGLAGHSMRDHLKTEKQVVMDNFTDTKMINDTLANGKMIRSTAKGQ